MTAHRLVLQQTMMEFQFVVLLLVVATPALAELRFAVPSYSSGPVHFQRSLIVPPPIPALGAVPVPSPVLPVPFYRNLAYQSLLKHGLPLPPTPEYRPPAVSYPVPAPVPLPVYGPPAPPPPPPLPVLPIVPAAEYGPPVGVYPAPVPIPFPEFAPPPPHIPPPPVGPAVEYGPPSEYGVPLLIKR